VRLRLAGAGGGAGANPPVAVPGPVAARRPPSFAPLLIVAASTSVFVGTAMATTLFSRVGWGATAGLRLSLAAVVLLALARPRLRGRSRREWLQLGLLGATLAVMGTAFYGAVDRVPLGVAATIEFLGPLTVAVAGSRRRVDLVWVALAVLGVAALAGNLTGGASLAGVGLALLAAAGLGAYLIASQRVGDQAEGLDGLAISVTIAAVLVSPFTLASADAIATPSVLGVGILVGLAGIVVPTALEMEALRRMRAGTVAVLLSLEPAIAAVVGFALLGQRLTVPETVGAVLVVLASIGALSGGVARGSTG
jgi:inner membrane transporter RhtA